MKKSLYIFLAIVVCMTAQRCKKEDRLDHIDKNAPAPGQISNLKVVRTPGGAIITYNLNSDPNLGYVKAVYEIQPGNEMETKSSIYTDTLKLEGFGDTSEYNVKIYSIGKNEKTSEPLTVKFRPLMPPVLTVFKTLKLEPGFSGVKASIVNPLEANLAIIIDADTVGNGVMRSLQSFYTKTAAGTFSVRGLSSKEGVYSVYLRDRWGNKSPKIVDTLIPLFEKQVPKPFAAYNLPTDTYTPASTNIMANIWDGKVDLNIFATSNGTPIPQWFTIDLKIPVVLSRMKEHQRTPPYTYVGASVKSFELWGSPLPAPDGSWASWTLIGKFDSFKPSGPGIPTAEDNAYAYTKGEDFEMPAVASAPAYRYLRFKTTETWGGTGQVTIAELTFWGQF